MQGDNSKNDDLEKIKHTAIERLNSFGNDLTIYTDGSVLFGWREGGCAAVITRGSAENHTVVAERRRKGSFFTCSYDEEVLGIGEALRWLEEEGSEPVTIATDSQSLCMALQGTGYELDELCLQLRNFPHQVTIQ